MPQPSALQSARSFLGTVAEDSVRCDRGLDSVPHNEAGLRCLAADGNWSAVAELAERLSAAETEETAEGLSKRLQFILVQVTANFHMQRYNVAKKLVESLGDLNSERYIDPKTSESTVPFSLRFISAIIPLYIGTKMDSQQRLYALLRDCRENLGKYASAVWVARIKRVQRALVVSHYQVEQYSEALRIYNELIAVEGNADGDDMGSYALLRRMLHLHQFAALALFCGNASFANSIYQSIASINVSEAAPCVQNFHECLVDFNTGIWLSFNGKVQDSMKVFCDVATKSREYYCTLGASQLMSTDVPTVSNRQLKFVADGCDALALSELCRHAFHQLLVNATTSHVVTMPYEALRGKAPATMLGGTIRTMEDYLRNDPVGLLSSDAFISNGVRLYTLEGGTQMRRLELLNDLIEVFRCDRASAPPIEKIV